MDGKIQREIERQNAASEANAHQQIAETSSDEYFSSHVDTTERTDPLLEDKQYIVTMIVNQFNELG